MQKLLDVSQAWMLSTVDCRILWACGEVSTESAYRMVLIVREIVKTTSFMASMNGVPLSGEPCRIPFT